MSHRIGNILIVLGLVAFVGATAWWITFFYDLLGDDFQVARECFYWTTELCSLKEAAPLITDVPVYDPKFLWGSAVLVAAGILLRVVGH